MTVEDAFLRGNPYYHDGTVHYLTGAAILGQDINSSNDVLTEGGSASEPILVHSTHGAWICQRSW